MRAFETICKSNGNGGRTNRRHTQKKALIVGRMYANERVRASEKETIFCISFCVCFLARKSLSELIPSK